MGGLRTDSSERLGCSWGGAVVPRVRGEELGDHLRAIRPLSVQALILGGPSCLVELQGGTASGGWQLVMSAYSLGMTNAQMIAEYQGKYLSIAGSYPRKAV